MIRFYYLAFFLFLLIAISVGWDENNVKSDLESINQNMDKLEAKIEKLRKDLQSEGILPYDEEEDYWKLYNESENPCMESVKKCI